MEMHNPFERDFNLEKEQAASLELLQMKIFEGLDEVDLVDLCRLMNQPVRAVHSCISKGQLRTLCKQLLAENLALQKRIQEKDRMLAESMLGKKK